MSTLPETVSSRRNWLRTFLGATAVAIASRSRVSHASAPVASIELLECAIAGFQFHAGERLWPDLAVGQSVELMREPANPYDANAIAVHWHGEHIGYVPKLANRALARRLDQQLPTVAAIASLQRHYDPWQRVNIHIRAPVGEASPASFAAIGKSRRQRPRRFGTRRHNHRCDECQSGQTG